MSDSEFTIQEAHTRDVRRGIVTIDEAVRNRSFAGYQPNPSCIAFVSIIAAMTIGFVVWRTR